MIFVWSVLKQRISEPVIYHVSVFFKCRTIDGNPSFLGHFHRRWKLFNIGGGGGANPAQPTSILGGGGGCKKYLYACVHMHIYAHTCVQYSNTHACMHTHVCMHAQPMQTYILHPNMKIIKIKASYLYEKQQQRYTSKWGKFWSLYCLKAIWICIYLYICIISIYKKPYILFQYEGGKQERKNFGTVLQSKRLRGTKNGKKESW